MYRAQLDVPRAGFIEQPALTPVEKFFGFTSRASSVISASPPRGSASLVSSESLACEHSIQNGKDILIRSCIFIL